MRRTNTAFYEGFVSSFFLQPVNFPFRTRDHANRNIEIGSTRQDWQSVANDFNHASDKVMQSLESNQRKKLKRLRYQYDR